MYVGDRSYTFLRGLHIAVLGRWEFSGGGGCGWSVRAATISCGWNFCGRRDEVGRLYKMGYELGSDSFRLRSELNKTIGV